MVSRTPRPPGVSGRRLLSITSGTKAYATAKSNRPRLRKDRYTVRMEAASAARLMPSMAAKTLTGSSIRVSGRHFRGRRRPASSISPRGRARSASSGLTAAASSPAAAQTAQAPIVPAATSHTRPGAASMSTAQRSKHFSSTT